jgi:putative transposase
MYLRAVAESMRKISYAGYRFPPEVIHQAVWLYLRFTLSFRDVEDLLAERGIAVSYETVRRWVNHFGPIIATHLRKRRPKPHAIWHLDEVYLKIDGRMVYLWRAVDAEGEALDVLVQSKRDKHGALKLMRKLLKKYAFAPERLVTDDLRSYGAAARDLASSTCMSAAGGRTIGPRIRISLCGDGSARCSASRAPAPRRYSSRPTPPCTTLSTSNAISRRLCHAGAACWM